MSFITTLISAFAPLFLILSPITSYTDQILSIHRTKTSAGFSLDIPLIMLTASILKLFYWPGARYDTALLIQSVIMVCIQAILLKVALDNRPKRRDEGPFMGLTNERPFSFWRWRTQRPYWEYLLYLTLLLCVLHYFLGSSQYVDLYTKCIGYTGLAVEATLPLPQIAANQRAQSCKGFRASVLANWLVGDTMKISYYLASEAGKVPWAFKMCGIFQACCDACLAGQYYVYGSGDSNLPNGDVEKKSARLA